MALAPGRTKRTTAGRPSGRPGAKTLPDADLVLRNHGIARLIEQGYTAREVARLFNLHVATVYRAIKSVQPDALMRGKRWETSPN